MDHICSPQDSLKASFVAFENDELFSDQGYDRDLSETVIKDDISSKERVIPLLKQVHKLRIF
jgi:hypothetical protein